MSKSSVDLALGVVVVAMAALGALVLIPVGIVLPDGIDIPALSPDFWPYIIMGVLGFAGLVIVLQALFAMRPGAARPDGAGAAADESADELDEELYPGPVQALRLGLVVVWLLALYALVPEISMAVATGITLAFLAWFAGERRWKIVLPTAILLPVLLHLFFVYVADVPLPTGIFEAWR